MCYHLLAVPAVGNVDDAAVATHIVVLYRHSRRLLVEMSSPRKACIDILRYSVAVHLPVCRNVHGLPCAVVEVGLVEVCRSLVGILYPVELPCSVEGDEVRALVHLSCQCESLILVSEIVGVQLEPVYLVYLQVVPFGERRNEFLRSFFFSSRCTNGAAKQSCHEQMFRAKPSLCCFVHDYCFGC